MIKIWDRGLSFCFRKYLYSVDHLILEKLYVRRLLGHFYFCYINFNLQPAKTELWEGPGRGGPGPRTCTLGYINFEIFSRSSIHLEQRAIKTSFFCTNMWPHHCPSHNSVYLGNHCSTLQIPAKDLFCSVNVTCLWQSL